MLRKENYFSNGFRYNIPLQQQLTYNTSSVDWWCGNYWLALWIASYFLYISYRRSAFITTTGPYKNSVVPLLSHSRGFWTHVDILPPQFLRIFPCRLLKQVREYLLLIMIWPKYCSFLRLFVLKGFLGASFQYDVIWNIAYSWFRPRYFQHSSINPHFEGFQPIS